jgi:hypothetical protein
LRSRRLWIAAAWLTGETIPLVLMAVFLFGCCVLPFHRYLHSAMPLCGGIVKLLASGPEEQQSQSTAPRAEEQTKPAPVVMASGCAAVSSLTAALTARVVLPSPREELRHGAARCDHDVGLHLLLATFLI